MMTDLIDKLHKGNYSCVIANGTEVRTFTQRGVTDLYELLKKDPQFMNGSRIADKVIGKGAAALMIQGGIVKVHADLISESALALFQKYEVDVTYTHLVPHIWNRDRTDWCPLEKSCKTMTSVDDILPIIDTFILKIKP